MKSFNIKVGIPKSINSIWWIIISLFISLSGSAQTSFPVRANIQIIPPYSPYLSDYTAPGTEKLAVTFLLNDPNETALRVKLKISIEGVGISIQTHPDFQPLPLTIEGGFQERLTSEDLAQYFDVNNLLFEGFTKQQYLKNAALPEGLYKFSVQAYDVQRNVAVSNKAVSTVWIMLNDPPLLLSPYNTAKVTVIYPQNLIFQWMRRQNSPNAANTEYHFKLVQIYPTGRNPNDAINSSVPIYETTTSNTSLYYGLSEPQLVSGHQYAWRVQAKEEGGKDMYKNNGYTETWMFTYGDPCKAPENIQLEVQSPKMVKLQWNEAPGAKKYIVHYRLKGFDSPSEWYKEEAFMTSATINGLKADNKYEYQIECVCEGASELSPVDTFSTFPNNTNKDCGKPFEVKVPDGSTRLSTLNINDILTVDGFNVRIAEATGSNGIFSGKGVAYIPFLNAYLKMNFAGITVNAQYQVVSGNIAADKADLSKYKNRVPVKNNVDFCNENPNETISKPKNTVTDNKPKGGNDQGKVIVINEEVEVKEGDKIILNGKETTVTKDTKINKGDVVTVDGKKIKVNTASEKNNGDNSGGKPLIAQVRFTPSADQKYGFDEKTNDLLTSKYSMFQSPVTKTTEYLSWKSVEAGRQDYVSATITGASNDFDFSKLKFTNASGSSFSVQESPDKNNLKITLQGGVSGDAQEVTASYQMKEDEHQTLSKLNVVTYEKIYRKVVLVPLAGVANIPSLSNIKDQLNKIYGPAIAEWSVTVASSHAPEKWDENGDDKIETGDGGLLSNYTSEMRTIIKSYKNSTSSFDKDACYVFLAGESKRQGTLGYMPRAKQFGFIFTNGQTEESLTKTIAHELGHGAFHLRHIFDETTLPARSTDNLMDYGPGTVLYKYQWDQVHDPNRVVGFLEDEANALMTDANNNNLIVQICDSIIKNDKIYYKNGNTCNLYVTVVTSDSSISQAIINLSVAISDSKTKMEKSFTLANLNSKQLLSIDSLPSGKYELKWTVGSKTITRTFFFRQNQCSYACKVCGRDLKITKERLIELLENNNLTISDADKFTDALKKAVFNTCRKQVHFFSQIGAETGNFKAFVEDLNYQPQIFLNLFKNNCNLKGFYNQSFWSNKIYKNYFSKNVYELNSSGSGTKYKESSYIKYTWNPDMTPPQEAYCVGVTKTAADTIKLPTVFNTVGSTLEGNYRKVNFNDAQKLANQKRLMSITYANRMGNGDSSTYDGYNFRGRGAIHLTGRGAYRDVSQKSNELFSKNFNWEINYNNLSTNKEDIIYSAAGFFVWKMEDLGLTLEYLQNNNCKSVSIKVNGGDNGYDKRKKAYNKIVNSGMFDCNIPLQP